MFEESFRQELRRTLEELKESGLYKEERILVTPQSPEIRVEGRDGVVLNFCANNYLGLSSHPKVIEAAHRALDRWGFGLSSVRFICGTQEIHKILERKVSEFLRTDDTILYAACFDANGGVFEPFMDADCAILTDELNHASIIDGIRLTKAQRFIYKHSDMNDLEDKLKQAQRAKRRMIATDGVFSMDGDMARLDVICDLAEKYGALVMVDDSHATGFVGKTGRGTPEYWGVEGRVDLITTTFGKALGGASGGCASGRQELIDWLRQRSRPYLFSNTLSPVVVGATIAVLDLLSETSELRDKLARNTAYFRQQITQAGFEIKPGDHPIVPIMLYEEKLAHRMARDLLDEGIYVIGFSYPVVPRGQARIRVQISAAHEQHHLDRAIEAFTKVGRALGVIA
ncbi:MAG: glycine C-acetyltransferase [candidate division KSB1 bacterium]|nr:glycine C-acetyltransferase [candidate division KSB1 bacterium]